jgi:hypothetical protein
MFAFAACELECMPMRAMFFSSYFMEVDWPGLVQLGIKGVVTVVNDYFLLMMFRK